MSNNYDEYDYEDSKQNNGIGRILLIVIFVILAIIIIIYLLSSCGNKSITNNTKGEFDYEKTLLNAGKKYFENNGEQKPISSGECTQVELQKLIETGLINSGDYDGCNLGYTYVRACMLASETIQYTPWLTCTNKNSDSEYAEAEENGQIITDSSYVDFKFIPYTLSNNNKELGEVQELWKDEIPYTAYKTISSTTYYKYRDKLYKWNLVSRKYYTSTGEKNNASDVKEYYTSSPNSKYTLNDDKTTEAYKWYTTTSEKEYALNSKGVKQRSATAIGDYKYADNGVTYDVYRTRTVTGTFSPVLYYVCATSSNSTNVVYQPNTPCGKGTNTNYTYEKKQVYACKEATDNTSSILDNIVSDKNYTCFKYSSWSSPTTTKCDTTNKALCESGKLTLYNWYKLVDGSERTYYPSGSSTSAGEKVYYTEAPVKNAIKDTATKTTAYKWYNETKSVSKNYTAVAPSGYYKTTKTSDYKWSDWTSKWSAKNPKVSDGRDRDIKTRVKIKLQEIIATSNSEFTKISDTPLTEQEMINLYISKGINVSSLNDINNNGQIKYELVTYVRNKKENN